MDYKQSGMGGGGTRFAVKMECGRVISDLFIPIFSEVDTRLMKLAMVGKK